MRVTLVCNNCGFTARRELMRVSGCRGTQETPAELAVCPRGHGQMTRKDGFDETWAERYRDLSQVIKVMT